MQVQEQAQLVYHLYPSKKFVEKHHEDPQSAVVHRDACHQCVVAW
jgi:hypothetical protein